MAKKRLSKKRLARRQPPAYRCQAMKGSTDIQALVRDFTIRLVAAAEAEAAERVRSAAASVFGLPPSRGSRNALRSPPQEWPAPRARRQTLSAKTLAARQVQGQYLGVLRGLAPAARERVKKVAKEKGVAAAVAFGKTLK